MLIAKIDTCEYAHLTESAKIKKFTAQYVLQYSIYIYNKNHGLNHDEKV